MTKIALAIHGGAGTILKSRMTPELEREYHSGLKKTLEIGWSILESGGSSLDCVEAAVRSLEDFPLFNAGRGAVFTHDGTNEMDASIMDGNKLRGGAVAFVRNVKNPISLARLVMERTEHVLLGGAGANRFAAEMGVEVADDEYFFTQARYDQLLRAREAGVIELDHPPDDMLYPAAEEQKPIGTVGAVACDSYGNLAAATSTGGMTNKKFGRIGDTPLIGSGTYAENATCAVSCTGHGEFFILGAAAYDVAARMKYKGLGLSKAAQETIDRLAEIGGDGGLIAVDTSGNAVLPFNSEGMYRGSVTEDGGMQVAVYA